MYRSFQKVQLENRTAHRLPCLVDYVEMIMGIHEVRWLLVKPKSLF